MNSHQQPSAGPSSAATNVEYHPPLPPHIPLSSINSLIPRLTTTINDIDSLKALIAAGNADGTLPSWDTLLQRYSLLLGRINALTNYLSPPPPGPGHPSSTSASAPGAASSSAQPPLDGFLVHPLNPLPDPTSAAAGSVETISPLAAETFFQVINTIPLPSLSDSQDSLLHQSSSDDDQPQSSTNTSRPQASSTKGYWHTADELRRMEERQLDLLKRSLKGRLEKEGLKASAIKKAIRRQEEEVDWTMRIGEDEDEDEEDQEEAAAGGDGGEEDDDDDDLFGGDDDEDVQGKVHDKMIIDVDADDGPTTAGAGTGADEQGKGIKTKNNPVRGWKVEDYIRFMDGGKVPPAS
ncbi:hypothetical protein I316_04014 [Kwoniella heveanensis BCC8398]|uniref:Uncharacterized protein n=1 Tax=Kwoniella heveanensis BCC8398 TaxID=1296120 RepID=A0A1B9GTW0_9TREE|nr:hypothetical protein I316_04014 [Kwoniella heveanensis BCC8398]